MENTLPLFLEESLKNDAMQAILEFGDHLSPTLTELADGQASRLTPMGDKSYAFVLKALEYAHQYPEFAGLIDVPEFAAAVSGYEALREIYIPMKQLGKKVHDTLLIIGSTAVNAALTYYGTAKEGRKRKKPNSIIVCNELGKRFPSRSKAPKTETGEANA